MLKTKVKFTVGLFIVTSIFCGCLQPSQDYDVFKLSINSEIGFGKNTKISKDLHFVVNGPLVGTNGKPVGGYYDRRLRKKWIVPSNKRGNFSKRNGIFGQDSLGRMFMFPYNKWIKIKETVGIKWAFQNGQMLVLDSANWQNPNSKSKYVRSGIGYLASGKIIVIVSRKKVTLWSFAEKFRKEGCTNAIFLDGAGAYVGNALAGEKEGFKSDATKLQFFHCEVERSN